jgi:penicillin-binding protein 2
MSFHPNDVIRRGRAATVMVCGVLVFLLSAFFNKQVLKREQLLLQSEDNRLRQIPLPAPRGVIYDRNGKIIADNVVGYSVALLTQSEDSLRANLRRLRGTIEMTNRQVEQAVVRYNKDRGRPTVILPDASVDVISVLEEHRLEFPNLIIQSSPKRIYPAGKAVGAFVGYISEINESELAALGREGYKIGQQIGKQGLEKQYEKQLRGREGVQFVEVDARNRVVRSAGARADIPPIAAPPLKTNIDLDLQTFIESQFGDSLSGGAVRWIPRRAACSPSIRRRRSITTATSAAFQSPTTIRSATTRAGRSITRPCKARIRRGRRGSWQRRLSGCRTASSRSKIACRSHAPATSITATTVGDVGRRKATVPGSHRRDRAVLRCVLLPTGTEDRPVATRRRRSEAGLQDQVRHRSARGKAARYSPTRVPGVFQSEIPDEGWTQGAHALEPLDRPGDNSQTILNMARFYAALATNGLSPTPHIAVAKTETTRQFELSPDQFNLLRAALGRRGDERNGGCRRRSRGIQMAGEELERRRAATSTPTTSS